MPKKYRKTATFGIQNAINEKVGIESQVQMLQNHADGGQKVDMDCVRT